MEVQEKKPKAKKSELIFQPSKETVLEQAKMVLEHADRTKRYAEYLIELIEKM